MKHKVFFLMGIIFILNLSMASTLVAAGVQPLLMELTAKPGETVSFQLKIVPGPKPEKINLKLCKTIQQINGDFTYEIVKPGVFPAADWFKIPAQIVTGPGMPNLVNGSIKVPFNAGGTYSAAIIVEPAESWRRGRINFTIRYAVRILVRIERSGLRSAAKITLFDMIKSKTGEPVIRIQARNTSPVDFMTSAEITIRDSHKKLIERVELRPGFGWNYNVNEVRLFPGNELQYTGSPREPLLPGQYEFRLFYRYGATGQILLTKTENIREGDYLYPVSKLTVLQIEPAELNFTGNPGSIAIKALKYENRSSRPVMVIVEATDVGPNYPYSIHNNTEFELKGEPKFILAPGRMATNILRVKFPENCTIQGNYGVLRVKVYTTDEKPKFIEESTVNLAATVIGKYNYAAVAVRITGSWNAGNYSIAVTVKNMGNIKISPTVQAFIRDYNDRLIETVTLIREGAENAGVFPDKAIPFIGSARYLTAGKYKVQIIINHEEQIIGSAILNLTVNPK
jgi:hypothetical protein